MIHKLPSEWEQETQIQRWGSAQFAMITKVSVARVFEDYSMFTASK